ncbi:UbiA family prenyltransferase [Candidatus Nitrotoga arctica]|uniref:Integral membrane protein n=1 Tax=Candidatus Nitrotoga arctica TaxID=453162 RepID=A0ABN8AQ73_9PROT|nr:UbiA family prenyltransferase [Candidatus Nitrotoga arctica]CAG9932808.1 integral membrane protein [Candidatus Nitrotoga arctica]
MLINRPLIVDLDGTLLRSDMLVESTFAFLRQNPIRALIPLFWLSAGKANLKTKLAAAVSLDVTLLPYDRQVIAFLEQEKAGGRTLILATASHQDYADAIATHLGLFARVLATYGDINLSARTKRDVLVREYGEKGFDYVGNSRDDLKVWASAHKAYLANPEFGVEAAATRLGNVEQVIRTTAHPWRAWIKQLRLHQWVKNALLFVPLLASHRVGELDLLVYGMLAFVFFGLCASSVYLLNDLLDIEDDRQHPSKRLRPLASGMVPIKAALLVFPALLLGAFAGAAWLLPWKFTLTLASYYALTLAYSLVLKRIMTVDVITLAMLYTMRIVAGTFAFDVSLTFWMLAFSMFLFLSLAMVKRYGELRESRSKGKTELTHGRGYYPGDLEMISSQGVASGYLAVMVLALYIQDQNTLALYHHPQVIWLACPLLLYWITRIWMIAHRGWMHDDPVVFAMKDRNSLLLGVLFAVVFWFAT